MRSERLLAVHGSVNLRELGGYATPDGRTIRWHKLLRSGDMSQITRYGESQLRRYGLKYDIDLRSPLEQDYAPDKIPAKTIFRSYPVYPVSETESEGDLPQSELAKRGAVEFDYQEPYLMMVLNAHSQLAFRCLFEDMLANDQPGDSLLFHCAAGKDRTGIAGFLILSALGVDYQSIRQDYLLTNVVYSAGDEQKLRKKLQDDQAAEFIKKMNASFNVFAEELDSAHQAVLDHYGSVTNYLREIFDLTPAKISQLQRIYLE
ncbi:MAG: tyrosine-protein phosphatase [Liquorilactobacillus nagelii]|jgi:protein-tyrosine phosphatase|uniref:Protein tyrosine phosphatase n=1 Tax=Liquorilactobacillus nagelii TaxID=82688 RepID=A0A3S6QUY0_9LACO|nr:tyrosine-protein phosphatase [Liquorilactobacillus nagelii]AUJ31863.1 protein tyrosine phosphatase [Liquorilactobacillus nagelii]MCC7615757.1 protein tyrosine phosphatase [Liquorilactobacillus nagelii]MCP9314063.1 tyrosine-protein phosphatase [Liquorilactobacillus nagelii]